MVKPSVGSELKNINFLIDNEVKNLPVSQQKEKIKDPWQLYELMESRKKATIPFKEPKSTKKESFQDTDNVDYELLGLSECSFDIEMNNNEHIVKIHTLNIATESTKEILSTWGFFS